MIEFANESIRNAFHLLPIEKQLEIERFATVWSHTGHMISINGVDQWGPGPDQSEVSIRIDKKFDPISTVKPDSSSC